VRRPAGLLASLALLAFALAASAAATSAGATNAAVAPRTSLLAVERQVMCVTCKIPLQEAQSPQADLEREYIQGLVDDGLSEAQIKRALVAQYGPTVLALPAAHGFDLAVYLVPAAVVLALLATVALLLPRWRRRARESPQTAAELPSLSAADEARLESDLARFD
jgi:cytochrome c-type biogenesis protein CcmH/NrfF